MNINEIDLNKIKNEELLEIYNATKETIQFLKNEINENKVESK